MSTSYWTDKRVVWIFVKLRINVMFYLKRWHLVPCWLLQGQKKYSTKKWNKIIFQNWNQNKISIIFFKCKNYKYVKKFFLFSFFQRALIWIWFVLSGEKKQQNGFIIIPGKFPMNLNNWKLCLNKLSIEK